VLSASLCSQRTHVLEWSSRETINYGPALWVLFGPCTKRGANACCCCCCCCRHHERIAPSITTTSTATRHCCTTGLCDLAMESANWFLGANRRNHCSSLSGVATPSLVAIAATMHRDNNNDDDGCCCPNTAQEAFTSEKGGTVAQFD
jgi:hypothetical protein